MISRERAHKAVRAGPLEAKGKLLSFLGKISDEELAKWNLEDSDEDKTIYDFILDQSQGSRLYNNVALFLPGSSHYIRRDHEKLTKNQLLSKLRNYRYVLPVKQQPPKLLQLVECPDTALDIEDVELQDGMRLAVVVHDEKASMLQLEQQMETLHGWQEGQIADVEYTAAEWSKLYLKADKGASRWCFQKLGVRVEGLLVQVEIDGLAHSEQRVVLVERKPCITLEYVEELVAKKRSLTALVECGAPNTTMLRDTDTGQIKHLEVFLMADGWADNPEEVAACVVRMEEHGIAPVLPSGDGGYVVGDSCGRWPLNNSTWQHGQVRASRVAVGRPWGWRASRHHRSRWAR